MQDFHGLRDFYFLAKTLASQGNRTGARSCFSSRRWPLQSQRRKNNLCQTTCRNHALVRAISRNFGGLRPESRNEKQSFYGNAEPCPFLQQQGKFLGIHLARDTGISVQGMLEDNLKDKHARHLMLICSGPVEVALSLIRKAAGERSIQIMMGSTFQEDQSASWCEA